MYYGSQKSLVTGLKCLSYRFYVFTERLLSGKFFHQDGNPLLSKEFVLSLVS